MNPFQPFPRIADPSRQSVFKEPYELARKEFGKGNLESCIAQIEENLECVFLLHT
jgi:hypothetical protein